MKSLTVLATLAAAITPAFSAIIPRQSGKLKPVTLKGNAFFVDDKRFYVRGVAYQPGGAADAQDPLLDIPSLKRDIANFKKLGINTIRIYTIDNSENHDEGMKLLDEAGIYLALDANTPKYSLNRETAATLHRSYNDEYLRSVFATVDAFAGYNNLLLFFSGNEVINAKNNTNAAPYIKAVTRDMKRYIAERASRPIPVGYSAADVAENIYQQALYFDCGSDDVRADFFAFNDYSWCDPSSFTKSGWDKKVELYKDYPTPIFLSEFGCITNEREWNEIEALYSTKMSAVYSGGLVYEYTVEPNGYGLVEVVDGEVKTNKDFDKLVDAYKKQKDPEGDGNYKENGVASQCPPADDEWEVENNEIPAIPGKAEEYFSKGAGEGPGLSGTGSHFAGETSTSTATPGAGPSSTSGSQNSTAGGGEGAAPSVPVPIYFMGMIATSVIFGAALIL